jgi:DNA polymerase III delta prime subunit
MDLKNNLWVEKWRPTRLEDYVWADQSQQDQVLEWVRNREIPNLLLSGSAGVGKTTLARCLFNELEVDPSDIKYVNASHHTGVDYYRSLGSFIETMPSGDFRYILLDEADYLSPNAQAILRSMMEEYSAVCRWVLTCNYPKKIIPALHSRTQGFQIDDLDREQFVTRIATILMSEGIEINEENLDIIDEYVTVTYPDLRKCINLLQQNCSQNQLKRPSARSSKGESDYMIVAVNLFKNGRIHDARKVICENITSEEFENVYRILYQNLNWWGNTEEAQHRAIVIIANRLKDHALVADPEIALAACLVELSMLAQS